jgi:hypothetical protein
MALTITPLGGSLQNTVNLGTFAPGGPGLYVLAVICKSSSVITMTATVDGNTMTPVETPFSDTNSVNIFYSETFSSGVCAINGVGSGGVLCEAYLITGYNSPTPFAINTNDVNPGTSNALTNNMVAGAAQVFAGLHLNSNATSWSAATSDRTGTPTGSSQAAAAHYVASGTETPHTETMSYTGSVFSRTVGAVWVPNLNVLEALNLASITATGYAMADTSIINDALNLASILATGYPMTDGLVVNETTVKNAMLATGYPVTDAVGNFDQFVKDAITLTGYPLKERVILPPTHAPTIFLPPRVDDPLLVKVRAVFSKLVK